jgi:hypothetical protein
MAKKIVAAVQQLLAVAERPMTAAFGLIEI